MHQNIIAEIGREFLICGRIFLLKKRQKGFVYALPLFTHPTFVSGEPNQLAFMCMGKCVLLRETSTFSAA